MTLDSFDEEDFKVFLEEGLSHLQTLERSLLVMEDNLEAAPDPGVVHEMFRAAHSLKGAAGLLGLRAIQELTHQLESLLNLLREGKLSSSHALFELLFEAVDLLGALMVEIQGEEHRTSTDVGPTVDRLREFQEGEPAVRQLPSNTSLPVSPALEEVLDAQATERLRRAMREGRYVYEVQVHLADCAYSEGQLDHPVLESLFGLCEPIVIHAEPPAPLPDSAAGQHPFPLEALILVHSSAEPAIVHMLVDLPPEQVRQIHDPAGPVRASAPEKAAVPAVSREAVVARAAASKPRTVAQSIRVDVARLDDLMNIVGEIVIGNTRLTQMGGRLEQTYHRDGTVQQLNESLEHLGRLVSDLHQTVIRARMIPVERVFNRFPRLVRDLALKLGKEVQLELFGQETEIDKTLSEELEDPLVHLIRNAIDHGIEGPEVREAAGKTRTGRIRIAAHHEGNYIVLVLEDDGAGIDPQKVLRKARELGLADAATAYGDLDALQFIFMPGFSTAERVTDVSGRGVGMDVVNQNIRKLKGSIQVLSTKGKGTKFIVKLPLTLAITKALLVNACGETFAIPLDTVRESIRVMPDDVQTINGRPVTQLRDAVLPLFQLHDAFGYAPGDRGGRYLPVVVIGGEKKQLGLVVDRLEGEQDIVIKSIGSYLGEMGGVAGATILGDGRVALILDVATLIDLSEGRTRHEVGAFHAR